ncbi:hypothetical protein FQU23_007770 [Flavobacterium sp. XN-5]|uniref:hypothetical protein n=1 Tax=Flavobacterium sp. XN-5 TaxID=2599390 RepID=UPI0011C8493F|nr:hypothetical protein [Flavobacterium sp. XN-5]NGY37412.1 hypothetical protein [Flavobacterium sp. XN-5]
MANHFLETNAKCIKAPAFNYFCDQKTPKNNRNQYSINGFALVTPIIGSLLSFKDSILSLIGPLKPTLD